MQKWRLAGTRSIGEKRQAVFDGQRVFLPASVAQLARAADS
jgi:hypothetical protein